MFKIKMLCWDYGNPKPYEDEPVFNGNKYDTYKEAHQSALQMAEEEAESLNEDCDNLTSFGIVENELEDSYKPETIQVLCYMLADETDTTGETTQVTAYWVEEIKDA